MQAKVVLTNCLLSLSEDIYMNVLRRLKMSTKIVTIIDWKIVTVFDWIPEVSLKNGEVLWYWSFTLKAGCTMDAVFQILKEILKIPSKLTLYLFIRFYLIVKFRKLWTKNKSWTLIIVCFSSPKLKSYKFFPLIFRKGFLVQSTYFSKQNFVYRNWKNLR
jgi:hypothetical protein